MTEIMNLLRSRNSEAHLSQQGALREMPMVVPEVDSLVVTPLTKLGDTPVFIQCPSCNTRALTTVKTTGSTMQRLVSALSCLFPTLCANSLHHFHRCSIFQDL